MKINFRALLGHLLSGVRLLDGVFMGTSWLNLRVNLCRLLKYSKTQRVILFACWFFHKLLIVLLYLLYLFALVTVARAVELKHKPATVTAVSLGTSNLFKQAGMIFKAGKRRVKLHLMKLYIERTLMISQLSKFFKCLLCSVMFFKWLNHPQILMNPASLFCLPVRSVCVK